MTITLCEMKLFVAFMILSVLGGSLGSMSVECHSQIEGKCDRGELPDAFPENVEELKAVCDAYKPFGSCVFGLFENCVRNGSFYDTEEDLDDFRKTLEFIDDSCEEDSWIFKAISDNLECVGSIGRKFDDACRWFEESDAVNEAMKDKIKKHLELERCTSDTWTLTCINAKFSVECGDEVRDAVSQILRHLYYEYYDVKCFEGVFPKISDLEDTFKSEFREDGGEEGFLHDIIENIEEEAS